jgi:hypothetical protein
MPSQISVFALATRTATALLACHLAAFFLALAGCSQFGKPEERPEPNVYPTNYKEKASIVSGYCMTARPLVAALVEQCFEDNSSQFAIAHVLTLTTP